MIGKDNKFWNPFTKNSGRIIKLDFAKEYIKVDAYLYGDFQFSFKGDSPQFILRMLIEHAKGMFKGLTLPEECIVVGLADYSQPFFFMEHFIEDLMLLERDWVWLGKKGCFNHALGYLLTEGYVLFDIYGELRLTKKGREMAEKIKGEEE